MELVNLTPHKLNLANEEGKVIAELPPSGGVARVRVARVKIGDVNGVPLFRAEYGPIEGLPEPRDGVIYIVSGLVAAAAARAGRTDVASPGELLRNGDGQPVAAIGIQFPA